MWNETWKENKGGRMSIVICDKCDKRVDIDYEDVFFNKYKRLFDYYCGVICIHCKEKEEEK